MKKFWLCWNPARSHPKCPHYSLEQAQEEAERIAKKEDMAVAVLECIGYMKPKSVPIEWVPPELEGEDETR